MYFNRGYELLMKNEAAQAEQFFRTALDLMPDRPRAPEIRARVHLNLGLCVVARRDYDQAREHFEIAKRLAPGLVNVREALLFPLLYSDKNSSRYLIEEHKAAGRLLEGAVQPPESYPNVIDHNRKLKVGFVSGDFAAHSVMAFFEPVLQNYDRERFEFTCYFESGPDFGKGPRGDSVTELVRQKVDRFRLSQAVRPADMAWQIGADGIDILVDLSGFTSHNRMDVFARKPAPVQATMIGYPHSTGLTRIGWRVVDDVTDPPGAEELATENLLRLPLGFSCYQPRPDAPAVVPPPSAAGGPITFGSFNTYQKLSETTLKVWAKLLRAVPGSRLLVKSLDLDIPYVAEKVLGQARDAGMDMDRFEIVKPVPGFAEHMACYARVDIGLDPFPYNGTTSTAEALWQGVPVVSLAGNRHAARVGASILHQLGLDELVAQDRDAYVEIARALASNPERLASLRAGMRERMLASPFCDGPGYTRRLEAGFRTMWTSYCFGTTGATSCRAAGL